MSVIRLKEKQYAEILQHLYSRGGEHFAFLHARWTYSRGKPVFWVHDMAFISDEQVQVDSTGWEVKTNALLEIVNQAVRSDSALIEVHNHGGQFPRFSHTDQQGFRQFVPYILESLPNRPYVATVWGDTTAYGEYFLPKGGTGTVERISVAGSCFAEVASVQGDAPEPGFTRQLPWFTEAGQRKIGRLRIAIVGAGGTGCHVAQALAYLGVRNFVIVDFDHSDETSMNRLVTANAADLDTPKAILARRLIKSVAPSARVEVLRENLRTTRVLDALKGVDLIFGCVDNDGARLVLNELALAYRIPLFDVAVGIDATDGIVSECGGRVAVVLAEGPCLACMNLIDRDETSYFLAPPEEQEFRRVRGYVQGMDIPAPSVVSLNGLVANAAVNEFAVYVSGIRGVNPLTEFDLLGTAKSLASQWLVPTGITRKPGCVQCAVADLGDDVEIERYDRADGLRSSV